MAIRITTLSLYGGPGIPYKFLNYDSLPEPPVEVENLCIKYGLISIESWNRIANPEIYSNYFVGIQPLVINESLFYSSVYNYYSELEELISVESNNYIDQTQWELIFNNQYNYDSYNEIQKTDLYNEYQYLSILDIDNYIDFYQKIYSSGISEYDEVFKQLTYLEENYIYKGVEVINQNNNDTFTPILNNMDNNDLFISVFKPSCLGS